MEDNILKKLLFAQKREISEYCVYLELAKKLPQDKSKILFDIANQEKKHYEILKSITKKEIKPSKIKVIFYLILAKIFGLNFALQMMEMGERSAFNFYQSIVESSKELKIFKMIEDEREHERKMISLIDEKKLYYISDFVLGLNDALVELTGALAGLTLALQNTKIIAMVGIITGIAASFSMGISNYLAVKEDKKKDAFFSGFVTGLSYIFTVFILTSPYLIFENPLTALIFTLSFAILIVAGFNFYISVVKREKFISRFLRMASLSLSVAFINFFIGFMIKKFFGIEV